jgi:hypothetical protein
LHDKLTNVREILEETNVQLLRMKNTSKEWQTRAYEAESQINELSFSHKKEKKQIEEQVTEDHLVMFKLVVFTAQPLASYMTLLLFFCVLASKGHGASNGGRKKTTRV